MKKLLLLSLITFVSLYVLFSLGISKFNRDEYIDQNVLDMASPLDVSIDTEFLQKLLPAYEQ